MNRNDELLWKTSVSQLARDGSLATQMHFAVKQAVLAPSIHNTQPWRFILADDGLLVCADRNRALPVVDPYHRQLVISCGAALFNLRVALAQLQLGVEIRTFPTWEDEDVLAHVRVNRSLATDLTIAELFPAIAQRVTNRGGFRPQPVPPVVQERLIAVAQAESVSLALAQDYDVRLSAATLISEGDRSQYADPRFRHELAAWTSHARYDDGMPTASGGVSALLDIGTALFSLTLRTFDVGDGVAASHRALALGSPLLACLSTPLDDKEAWLSTGQALQRVLLTATAAGFDASFLNQAIEVDHLRPRLRELLGTDTYPQILLRLGQGKPEPHSQRRPVSEVL